MRFTILLTLCVLGVASAGSLNKRTIYDDMPEPLQKAFREYKEEVQVDPEAAYQKYEAAVKSYYQNLEGKTVEKRDLAEQIQKLTGQAKENFEKNVKALQDFFAQFNKKSSEPAAPVEAEAEVVVEKRDLAENIQKLTGQAKENFEKNLKAIMDFFAQFNKQQEASVESEAETVVKRDVREEIQKFLADAQNKAKDAGGNFLKDARAKLMQAVQQFLKDAQAKAANVGSEVQKAIDQLFAVAEKKVEESQNVVKRDVQSDIQNFIKDAQTKAQNAGENFLKDARAKVMSALQKFLADAQNKTQNVGAEIQKAIDSFFAMAEKKVGAPEVPAQAA